MKVSFADDFALKATAHSPMARPRPATGQKMTPDPISSFENFLNELIEAVQTKNPPYAENISLNQSKLRDMAMAIRMKLNEQLFSLISDPRRDRSEARSALALMNFTPLKGPLPAAEPWGRSSSSRQHPVPTQGQHGPIIDHAAKTYNLDPDLIRAVIRAESDFDAKAVSPKGAMGLMQLMPETAQDLGIQNPFDPLQNIMGGTRYLKGLLKRYDGDPAIALAAYNWGPGNVERHPGNLPKETETYISRVHQYYLEAKS